MSPPTTPTGIRTRSAPARCEYDDGNPGTIVTSTVADASIDRRAGAWAQSAGETYYDDGEAGTVLG